MKTIFTMICKETFLIATFCGIYFYNISLACSVDSIAADNWLKPGFALENAAFWSGKMDGITDCAIGCVRRKVCTSFNYDMATNLCDLNYFHEGQVSLRSVSNNRVYSTISNWPPEIDPSCSSRPCTENQVCLPPILSRAPLTQCSYTCIDLTIHRSRCTGNSRCAVIGATCSAGSCLCPDGMDYDVTTKLCTACPADPSTMYPNAVIEPGTGVERYFSCLSKYVKTVSKLECRLNNNTGTRSWYPDADICADMYGSNCTSSAECMAIGADCLGGTCQCDANMVYDATVKNCRTTCIDDPSALYANATFEPGIGEKRNFTCVPKYVKAVTQIECRLNSFTGTRSWYPATDICIDLYGSECMTNTECVDIGADCQNGICQCSSDMVYDAWEKNCRTTCTDDPITMYANATFESGTGEERNFTCVPKFIKAVTQIECRLDSSTGTRSWYPPTDICIDLYGSNCTANAECADIAADCQSGTCQCGANMLYDVSERNCRTTCTDDPSTLYANATIESGTGEERNFTCVPKYAKAVTQIECRLDGSTGTRNWYPPTEICIDLYGSNCTANAECTDIGAVCQSGTCQCDANKVYDASEKNCRTTCTDDPSTLYTNATFESDTGEERNFTCVPKYVKAVTQIECRLDSSTGTRSWYPPTDICLDLYGSNCTANAECTDIGAVCQSGTCQCGANMVYDASEKNCRTTCTDDPSTLYANATFESGTGEERNFTCVPKYVKAVTQIECRLDSSTGTRSWYPSTDICLDLYGSNCTANAECMDIGAVCQSGTCQCDANKVYDASEKNCRTTCTDDPNALYANATFESDTGEERNFTCVPKYVKAVNQIECRLDSSTGTRSWYPLTDICLDLYGSNCTANAECTDIGAVCQSGTCQCDANKVYDASEKNCRTTCIDDPSTLYANATFESGTGEERNFTCAPKYVKAVTQIECRLDGSTGARSWYPPTDICLDLYGSNCTANAECTDIGADCESGTCQCGANLVYDTSGKNCRTSFQLEAGNSRGNGVNMGRLKYYYNDQWFYVSHDDWSWKGTKAVCRDIDPSFVHGGSFHRSPVYGEGSNHKTAFFKDLDCATGDGMSLLSCSFTIEVLPDDHDKDIGITCFTEDVSGHMRLNPSYTENGLNTAHRLEVQYNGIWGAVCKTGFGGTEDDIACKSIDPSKPRKDQTCTDSCAGGPLGPYIINDVECDGTEDHFFFCENGGWGNHDCPTEMVGLICKT